MAFTSLYIGGVRVDIPSSREDVLKHIEEKIDANESCYICTTNPEFIIDAQKDKDFKDVINNSVFSLPDGFGILFADKYTKEIKKLDKDIFFPIKAFLTGLGVGLGGLFGIVALGDRIAGSDLIYNLCEVANKKGYNVFFLGGRFRDWKGISKSVSVDLAKKTSDVLKAKYPNLNVIGASSSFSHKESDDGATLKYIHDCMKEHNVDTIDLVFVAYGHVNQEKWIRRNSKDIPAKLAIGVGGSFDYVSGMSRRAPRIFVFLKIEWIFRLLIQPFRISRIIKAFPTFPLFVYKESIKKVY